MFQSEELSSYIKKFLFYTLLILIFSCIFSLINTRMYQSAIQKENAKMISILVSKYPSMELDIIRSFQNKGDIKKGEELLNKYGININTISSIDKNNMLEKTFLISFGLSFCVLFITSFFNFLHVKNVYKKLNYINNYINQVLNGNDHLNLKEYKEGYFSTLKNDVYKITNKLKEQKQQLIDEKKYLESTLSDISHQIKTPLTSMYVLNNLLGDSKLDPKVRNEFVRKNEMQLERMEWLVSSLLKLSRLESGVVSLKCERVNLYSLLMKSIEPISIPIDLKNQVISIQGKKNICINCDLNWTIEAIVNIIKNAYEHTPMGGSITLSYIENPIYVELLITDSGEGIVQEDKKHIFERFYKSNKNTKDSIGIGLNMSKMILSRQNATIDVKSEGSNGTTFIIRFFKNNL